MYFAVVNKEDNMGGNIVKEPLDVQTVIDLFRKLFLPVAPKKPFLSNRCGAKLWNPGLFESHVARSSGCMKILSFAEVFSPPFFVIYKELYGFLLRVYGCVSESTPELLPLDILDPFSKPVPQTGSKCVPGIPILPMNLIKQRTSLLKIQSFLDLYIKSLESLKIFV